MNYDFLNVKSEHHDNHEFVKELISKHEHQQPAVEDVEDGSDAAVPDPLSAETVIFTDEVKLYVNKVKESNLFIMTLENLYISDIDTLET